MAEWSKATDLRPVIVRCVGSNPTSCNYIKYRKMLDIEKYNIVSITATKSELINHTNKKLHKNKHKK